MVLVLRLFPAVAQGVSYGHVDIRQRLAGVRVMAGDAAAAVMMVDALRGWRDSLAHDR